MKPETLLIRGSRLFSYGTSWFGVRLPPMGYTDEQVYALVTSTVHNIAMEPGENNPALVAMNMKGPPPPIRDLPGLEFYIEDDERGVLVNRMQFRVEGLALDGQEVRVEGSARSITYHLYKQAYAYDLFLGRTHLMRFLPAHLNTLEWRTKQDLEESFDANVKAMQRFTYASWRER